MSNVHQFPTKPTVKIVEPLKCIGVCRDKECPNSLVILTNRPPSDDEMRFVHEQARDMVHVAYLSNLKEEPE